MNKNQIIFERIDRIRENIDRNKIEEIFDSEVEERNNRKVPDKITDDELLKVFATLVAFSQTARAKLVKPLVLSAQFDEMFENFSVDNVAKMNGDEFIEKYWKKNTRISVIKFKSKIYRIIEFAQKIQEFGSLSTLLKDTQLPERNNSEKDIDDFWIGFDILRERMLERNIPFLKSTTTLLHYLLDTGYDCIKPDLVVMKVAKKIGIVDNEKGDLNLRKTVPIVQEYALTRNIRPSILDLYFLIDEKQTGTEIYVNSNFLPSS